MNTQDFTEEPEKSAAWSRMSYFDKNKELLEWQKRLLDLFLEKNAISREEYKKSHADLTAKMKP